MKKITTNLSIKLISLLAAIIIWTVSMDAINPVTDERTISVSKEVIEVKNASHIKEKNEDYKITPEAVEVQYKTLKSVADNIKPTDFNVYIDLAQVTSTADVKVECKPNDNIRIIKVKPSQVRVSINERGSITLPVLHSDPINVKSGLIVGDIELVQEKIDIKGSDDDLKKVGYVFIDIDLSGAGGEDSYNGKSSVKIYAKDGSMMSNDLFELVPAEVDYTVKFNSAANINVNVQIEGEPEAPNNLLNTIVEPNKVIVTGPKKDLETYYSTEPIKVNISGLTESKDFIFNLSDYLKKGVTSKTKEIKVSVIISSTNVINQPKETKIGPHIESDTSASETSEFSDTGETIVDADILETTTAANG